MASSCKKIYLLASFSQAAAEYNMSLGRTKQEHTEREQRKRFCQMTPGFQRAGSGEEGRREGWKIKCCLPDGSAEG